MAAFTLNPNFTAIFGDLFRSGDKLRIIPALWTFFNTRILLKREFLPAHPFLF